MRDGGGSGVRIMTRGEAREIRLNRLLLHHVRVCDGVFGATRCGESVQWRQVKV